MKEDFKNYLQDRFVRENPCVLDDDIPDSFADWLCDMDVNEMIEYANEWGKKIQTDTAMECAEIAEPWVYMGTNIGTEISSTIRQRFGLGGGE